MNLSRIALRAAALAAAALGMYAASAQAPQSGPAYPAKPIRLVITFPPGGSTDVVARIVTAKLGERLGQPIVIDNRPGGGGNIGAEAVAKSPADGYTLLLGPTGVIAINASLYSKIPYDPVKDFAPISLIGKSAFVLLAPADRGPATVREFVALAKSQPGRLTYGSGGNGTAMHLSGEMFKMVTATDIVHVPFKSSGIAMTAMMGGQPDSVWADMATATAGLRSGRVRVLGVAAKERSAVMPEVPTFAESGIPLESIGWYGFFAPAGTPAGVVSRLSDETAKVIRLAEVRERIFATGNEPVSTTPEEFSAFIKSEITKWAAAVKQSGAKVD